jgi:hypothetical protein
MLARRLVISERKRRLEAIYEIASSLPTNVFAKSALQNHKPSSAESASPEATSPRSIRIFTINPVQPVWWLAPQPRPVSP